jgi:hypothetical protein
MSPKASYKPSLNGSSIFKLLRYTIVLLFIEIILIILCGTFLTIFTSFGFISSLKDTPVEIGGIVLLVRLVAISLALPLFFIGIPLLSAFTAFILTKSLRPRMKFFSTFWYAVLVSFIIMLGYFSFLTNKATIPTGVKQYDFSKAVTVNDSSNLKSNLMIGDKMLVWTASTDPTTQDIYTFTFDPRTGVGSTKKVTDFGSESDLESIKIIDGKIYYLEKTGIVRNLYQYNPKTNQTKLILKNIYDFYGISKDILVYSSVTPEEVYGEGDFGKAIMSYNMTTKKSEDLNLGFKPKEIQSAFFLVDGDYVYYKKDEIISRVNLNSKAIETFSFADPNMYDFGLLAVKDNMIIYMQATYDFPKKEILGVYDIAQQKTVFTKNHGGISIPNGKIINNKYYYVESNTGPQAFLFKMLDLTNFQTETFFENKQHLQINEWDISDGYFFYQIHDSQAGVDTLMLQELP